MGAVARWSAWSACCACTCAQLSFGLSDEAVADAIYDSQTIRSFVGIRPTHESTPDATTFLKFRSLLEKYNLTRRIFDEINCLVVGKGLMMREGTIMSKRPENADNAINWHTAIRPSVCKASKKNPLGRAKVEHCFIKF